MKPHAGFAEPDSALTRHRSSTTHHTCDMNSTPDDHDIFCAEYEGDGTGCDYDDDDDDDDDDGDGYGSDSDAEGMRATNLAWYYLMIDAGDDGDSYLPFDCTADYSAA